MQSYCHNVGSSIVMMLGCHSCSMAKTLGPVALKLGDEVLVKVRTDTTVEDLLEQLDKACKGGRIQDADGFDVTAHNVQNLPEGEYAIKQPTTDSMSISVLRQVFAEKLGERDTNQFSDGHLQNLLDKECSDEGALQDATREGLQTPPALPPALIDKILKAFGQPGEKYDMCWQAIAVQFSKHTSLFCVLHG